MRASLRASLVAILLLAVSPVARAAAAPAASASVAAPAKVAAPSDEGLKLEASTTYVLDPSAKAVHVTYEAAVTNTSPTVYGFYYSSTPYLTNLGLPVPKEAVNAVATHPDGSPLSVTLQPTKSDFISVAVIDLVPDLFYPDTQTVRLTYDLPPQPARSAGIVRLNDAFATFPTFALGDPGKSTVKVVIPDRFDVEVIGDDLTFSEEDGNQVYLASGIKDPDHFFTSIVAHDDDKLTARNVELGAVDARVLGWPDDTTWIDFAAKQLKEGVPALSKLIGMPWPAKRRLDVTETVSPYIYGYAGWYSPHDSNIDVGDELNQQVILHEMSHLWFNRSLFTDRWIDEGLADLYAAHAMTALGATAPVPDAITPGQPGSIALEDWSDPDLQDDIASEQEAFGYNASWAILDKIATEVGMDKLSAVVRTAKAKDLTYSVQGQAEPLRAATGWHQLLDLLQDQAGSTQAEPLFWEHVASGPDRAVLADRTAVRSAYAELTAAASGWAPPTPIRAAMSRWDFATATDLITQARPLLALKDRLTTELGALGIKVPASLRTSWETADSIEALKATLEGDLATVGTLTAAKAGHGPKASGPLASIGLAIGPHGGRLASVRKDLAQGDFAGAATSVDAYRDEVAQATQSGVARIFALLALVGAIVLLRRSKLRPPADWPSVLRGSGRAVLWAPISVLVGVGRRRRRRTVLAPPVGAGVAMDPPDPYLLDLVTSPAGASATSGSAAPTKPDTPWRVLLNRPAH